MSIATAKQSADLAKEWWRGAWDVPRQAVRLAAAEFNGGNGQQRGGEEHAKAAVVPEDPCLLGGATVAQV